jgi:hypothetical protein
MFEKRLITMFALADRYLSALRWQEDWEDLQVCVRLR